MTITFVPNDPAAKKPDVRSIKPRPNRKPGQVGFTFDSLPVEKPYPVGTREFLFWQCREAALLTLDMWEDITTPIKGWAGQPGRKRLRVKTVAGVDLNAYYDRNSLSFFQGPEADPLFFSGASTDVVAHETGHALLDALRPDLWDSMYFETSAFHEAFGDCISVLVALYDKQTRIDLLGVTGNLGKANFVEATAEDLSGAVLRLLGARHNASKSRPRV